MSLETIYVTRHGFRSNWLVNPSTGGYTAAIKTPTGIAADPALTAHGVAQAKELAAHLLTVVPPIDQVYSSPYYRCLQTIEPFVNFKVAEMRSSGEEAAPQRHFKIRAEAGISEWYGSAPFDHPTPAALERLKAFFPTLDESYTSVVIPERKGESIAQLHDRIALSMQRVIEQCDEEGLKAIVICSHAAPIIALGRVLTGVMPEEIEQEDFHAFTCGLGVYQRRRKPSAQVSSNGGQNQRDTSLQLQVEKKQGGADDPPGSEPGVRAIAGKEHPKPPTQDEVTKPANSAPVDLPGTKEDSVPLWRDGHGVGGGWDCELDSDCSFLSAGEERGWRFSGDESFAGAGRGDTGQADAGISLGVVVEGRHRTGHPHKGAGSSRL